MPSVYRVYYSPYSITKAQTGTIDPYKVKNTSSFWFNSAGISTARGAPPVTRIAVSRLQNVIYSDLEKKARELRYVENCLNRAYGRNRAGLSNAVIAGTPSYKGIGLTFNGKTYKTLYNEYFTMVDAVGFTAGILRSWSSATLY